VTIFIHFYILLGFLDLVGHIVLILFIVYFNFKISKTFLSKTGCLVWDIFCSLSLTTQVFIFIRLYLLLYNLSYDNLDYILSATSNQNVMDISNILNTESSSVGSTTSTGGQNPPPTGNTGDGVSGNNASMANIKAKLLLQSREFSYNKMREIYSQAYSPSAALNSAEINLLGSTIAEDTSDTRPYGVIHRTVDNQQVQRVVMINRGRFDSTCRNVYPNGPFRAFLDRYP
jgi:hypothetical protein